jgi:formate--tetrahydrofolate ligase
LKEALKPNLVQSLEGTPAFVHGGPFANIAHGCNSVLATKMGLSLAEVVVTEAGFGADLGAEKFFDIKCRSAGLRPSAAAVVATLRALKHHGGVPKAGWGEPDRGALDRGLPNLLKHCEIVRGFGVPCVVAVNRFPGDTDEELGYLVDKLKGIGVPAAVADIWERGGDGGLEVAEKLLAAAEQPSRFRLLYDEEMQVKTKIGVIAQEIYGASGVVYAAEAESKIAQYEKLGLNRMPVCMAKTQYSLSDDGHLLGRPEGFTLTVRDLRVSAGAGFLVALTGSIMTMPGLPRRPAAEEMRVDPDGTAHGLS